MKQRNGTAGKAKTPRSGGAGDSITEPASAFHNKRVRLVRVTEGEALAVEQHELLRHVGKEGIADSLDSQGAFAESVSVRFNDGCRLTCLPEELEVCTTSDNPASPAGTSGEGPISYVQSCVAHVGFPDSLAGLSSVFSGEDDTDMEKLLWPPPEESGNWTAPRWLTQGDIIFFYHTKKAQRRITRLLKASTDEEWAALPDPDAAIARVADQLDIAMQYGGTIFACARVTGAASYWRDDDRERDRTRHWRSNIYAQISSVHIFAHPVTDAAFRPYLTISPGGAITPIHGQILEKMKASLAEKNQLPDYLVNARPGGVSFRDVSAKNWIDISCSPQARFIDESQLRAYLLDYLLEELKDPRTTVHQECRCGLGKKYPSIADYFVRVHGRWVPVEAKLNIRAERDLPGQVSKYLGVAEFVPTRGTRTGELITGPVASACLVADAVGLYILDSTGYVDCGPEQPVWRRTELTPATISEIRDRLR